MSQLKNKKTKIMNFLKIRGNMSQLKNREIKIPNKLGRQKLHFNLILLIESVKIIYKINLLSKRNQSRLI